MPSLSDRAQPVVWHRNGKYAAYLAADHVAVFGTGNFERLFAVPTATNFVAPDRIAFIGDSAVAMIDTVREQYDVRDRLRLYSVPEGTLLRSELFEKGDAQTLFFDEAADVIARLLIPDRLGQARPVRYRIQLHGLRSPRLVEVPVPEWFGSQLHAPELLARSGGLCLFSVPKPSSASSFEDYERQLAVVDLLHSGPFRRIDAYVGPYGKAAVSSQGQVVVKHGPGWPPVMIDLAKATARALGPIPRCDAGSCQGCGAARRCDATEPAGCVAFSSDGKLVATTADMEPVQWYDVDKGRRVGVAAAPPPLAQHESVARWRSCGIRFTAQDKTVLDYNELGDVEEIDIKSGAVLHSADGSRSADTGPMAVGNANWWTSGAMSPSRLHYAVWDADTEEVTIVDLRTWKSTTVGGGAHPLEFSEDGTLLVAGARMWNVQQASWIPGSVPRLAGPAKQEVPVQENPAVKPRFGLEPAPPWGGPLRWGMGEQEAVDKLAAAGFTVESQDHSRDTKLSAPQLSGTLSYTGSKPRLVRVVLRRDVSDEAAAREVIAAFRARFGPPSSSRERPGVVRTRYTHAVQYGILNIEQRGTSQWKVWALYRPPFTPALIPWCDVIEWEKPAEQAVAGCLSKGWTYEGPGDDWKGMPNRKYHRGSWTMQVQQYPGVTAGVEFGVELTSEREAKDVLKAFGADADAGTEKDTDPSELTLNWECRPDPVVLSVTGGEKWSVTEVYSRR